ncbi:hypothetical protein IAR55_005437 [Kwoniella newhampshirensis]|uniref:Oxidoreductase-like domain-containing protein n=1 Tax=Kwoniella newhampshirensis TaxID=1651941 RepID=A0AAW0YZ70_9TREE
MARILLFSHTLTPAMLSNGRSIAHGRAIVRGISSAPPPRRRRRNLDLLAPFRPAPIPSYSPSTQLQDVLQQSSPGTTRSPSAASSDAFETSSTSPTSTSLQETPLDTSKSDSELVTADNKNKGVIAGTKIVEPIPAMKNVPGPKKEEERKRRKKEMIVLGIPVPPKPVPPGEEECCMSGCINCVYTIYSSELEEYTAAIDQARSALESAHVDLAEWPEELRKGSGESVRSREEEKGAEGMDASMSAFLALENKLKKKQAPESSAAV